MFLKSMWNILQTFFDFFKNSKTIHVCLLSKILEQNVSMKISNLVSVNSLSPDVKEDTPFSERLKKETSEKVCLFIYYLVLCNKLTAKGKYYQTKTINKRAKSQEKVG